MKRWNIYVTLKSRVGTVEAPNKHNPVEAASLVDLLMQLSTLGLMQNKPGIVLECTGVRVEECHAADNT